MVLDPGTKVYVVQPGAKWAKVRTANRVGWIMIDAFPIR